MMRKSRSGDVELDLNLADNEAFGMRAEQKLHNAQARLDAHRREHVGKAGNLVRIEPGGSGGHSSIVAEIRKTVKGQCPPMSGGSESTVKAANTCKSLGRTCGRASPRRHIS